jgi:hypothetical protein
MYKVYAQEHVGRLSVSGGFVELEIIIAPRVRELRIKVG